MSKPLRDERSASDALGLMVGWLWVMFGLGGFVFGSLRDWKGWMTLIAIGAAFVVPILWRERRARLAHRPVEPSPFMAGWVWIVMGIASLAVNLKEWKAPVTIIAFGVASMVAPLWRDRRKRSAQEPAPEQNGAGKL